VVIAHNPPNDASRPRGSTLVTPTCVRLARSLDRPGPDKLGQERGAAEPANCLPWAKAAVVPAECAMVGCNTPGRVMMADQHGFIEEVDGPRRFRIPPVACRCVLRLGCTREPRSPFSVSGNSPCGKSKSRPTLYIRSQRMGAILRVPVTTTAAFLNRIGFDVCWWGTTSGCLSKERFHMS
jgi:hypothetical protein